MVYHSIRRAAAATVNFLGNIFPNGDHGQQTVDIGNQGVEMDTYRTYVADLYAMEENGYFAIVFPMMLGPPVFRGPRRFRRSYKVPGLKLSGEVAILAAFGLLITLVIMLPYLEGLGSAFDYPAALNVTELMQSHAAAVSAAHLSYEQAHRTGIFTTDTQTYASASVPGFYLVPTATVSQENHLKIDQMAFAPVTMAKAHATLAVHVAHTTDHSGSPAHVHRQVPVKMHASRQPMMHHAYPMHSPQILRNGKIFLLKAELEDCAHKVLAKFEHQGVDTTGGLEFLLHDCKAAFDEALKLMYKPAHHQSARTTCENCGPSTPLEQTIAQGLSEFTNVPALKIASNSSECVWKRPTSLLTGRICSHRFCDWTSTGDLHRCYEKNNTWSVTQGGGRYLNDSVDDFKTGAPIECNLCLPKVDCQGIDMYCQDIETAERRFLQGLLISLGMLLVMSTLIMLLKRW